MIYARICTHIRLAMQRRRSKFPQNLSYFMPYYRKKDMPSISECCSSQRISRCIVTRQVDRPTYVGYLEESIIALPLMNTLWMTNICIQVQELVFTASLQGNRGRFKYGQLPFNFVFISSLTLQRREIHDNIIQYLKISWKREKMSFPSIILQWRANCWSYVTFNEWQKIELKWPLCLNNAPGMDYEVSVTLSGI